MKYPQYESYKESGIDWLGQVPKSWIVKKIKWDTAVFRGASPRPIDDPVYFDDDGDYAWVRIADVTASGKFLEKTTQRLSALGASLSVKMQPKSLFLSIAGSVGKPCITNIKCCIHDGFVYFPFLKINQDFLYFIFAGGESYKGLGKLGTQLNLNTETVGSISIAIPPSTEQKFIANFLDKETTRLDALIAKKQQLIETLKEKRIAVISHAVTKGLNPDVPMKNSEIEWLGEMPEHWEVKKLKYNVTKVGSGVTPEGGATIYEDEGIPLIRSQNVYSNGLRLEDVVYISGEIHNNMNNSKVKKGDVLLNITGASLGRCYYMDDAFTEANVNQHVCIIRPIAKKLATKYLHLLLISEAGQEQIWNNQTGSGREGLNFVSIKNFSFAYPPTVEEQEEIIDDVVQKIIKIDLLLAKTEQALNKLQDYKTALISAAVTGKIKVPEQA